MKPNHATVIIPNNPEEHYVHLYKGEAVNFNTLEISYEESENYGDHYEPESAVLLISKCCPSNHDHIRMNKEQANKLILWLLKFVEGEYDV